MIIEGILPIKSPFFRITVDEASAFFIFELVSFVGTFMIDFSRWEEQINNWTVSITDSNLFLFLKVLTEADGVVVIFVLKFNWLVFVPFEVEFIVFNLNIIRRVFCFVLSFIEFSVNLLSFFASLVLVNSEGFFTIVIIIAIASKSIIDSFKFVYSIESLSDSISGIISTIWWFGLTWPKFNTFGSMDNGNFVIPASSENKILLGNDNNHSWETELKLSI